MVIYYHLPETVTDSTEISLEIKDETGALVRMISSKNNPDFKSYPGGPSAEPVLTVKKGVNRFVYDLRYTTMPGIPTAYIESSYAGHKIIPGTYTLTLKSKLGDSQIKAIVKDNPNHENNPTNFKEYHAFMNQMESELTLMHTMVNKAMDYQTQLEALLNKMEGNPTYTNLLASGKNLMTELKAWDENMVQRKSTAYDDVENFPNKFTANYMFLINQTDSSIPKVNKGSRDRYAELTKEWEPLKAEGTRLLEVAIPAFNKMLGTAGIGVLFVK
jgi:hypothetical protein